MATHIQGNDLRVLTLGRKVVCGKTALPQTATVTMFTIAGGRVIVTSLTGVVTTIVQAQANAIKWVATPTTGTANDISGTVETNAAEVGAMFSLDGVLATALQGNVSKSGAVGGMTKFLIANTGTLGLNAAASNTGAITWTATYIPLDDGATLVTA
jgi:hypothetical protein